MSGTQFRALQFSFRLRPGLSNESFIIAEQYRFFIRHICIVCMPDIKNAVADGAQLQTLQINWIRYRGSLFANPCSIMTCAMYSAQPST